MADPAVLGLIGTLSGTALGFAGGLITQLLLEHKKRAAETKKRKAEKLEELVSALYEHQHWMTVIVDGIRVSGKAEEQTIPVTPLAKAKTICSIYFPQFEPWISAIDDVTHKYSIWMIDASLERAKTGLPTSDMDSLKKVCLPYFAAHKLMLDEIRKYAKREFQ